MHKVEVSRSDQQNYLNDVRVGQYCIILNNDHFPTIQEGDVLVRIYSSGPLKRFVMLQDPGCTWSWGSHTSLLYKVPVNILGKGAEIKIEVGRF